MLQFDTQTSHRPPSICTQAAHAASGGRLSTVRPSTAARCFSVRLLPTQTCSVAWQARRHCCWCRASWAPCGSAPSWLDSATAVLTEERQARPGSLPEPARSTSSLTVLCPHSAQCACMNARCGEVASRAEVLCTSRPWLHQPSATALCPRLCKSRPPLGASFVNPSVQVEKAQQSCKHQRRIGE